MDTSFQTPSPVCQPNDLPTVAGQLELSSSDERETFVDDLFGATSSSARTLQAPPRQSFVDSSPGNATFTPVAHHGQQFANFLERLSSVAITVDLQGLQLPNFSIVTFQRNVLDQFGSLHPSSPDSALVKLVEQYFTTSTQPPSLAASFAAIGESLARAPSPSPSPPSTPSSTPSSVDSDIAPSNWCY